MNGNDEIRLKDKAAIPEKDDAAFGGCRYRLSYDRYENESAKKPKAKHIKASTIIIALVLICVFAGLGFFIVKYYNSNVSRIYQSDNPVKTSVKFQSFDDIDIYQ